MLRIEFYLRFPIYDRNLPILHVVGKLAVGTSWKETPHSPYLLHPNLSIRDQLKRPIRSSNRVLIPRQLNRAKLIRPNILKADRNYSKFRSPQWHRENGVYPLLRLANFQPRIFRYSESRLRELSTVTNERIQIQAFLCIYFLGILGKFRGVICVICLRLFATLI